MAAASTMLAYTIRSYVDHANPPNLLVGYGRDMTFMGPDQPQDDSYWIVFFSRNNPRQKIKEFMLPGVNASIVPGGIDTYINDPEYFFVVATQALSTLHVPQGAFYDFLTTYGAGRELQKLEQLNTVLSCGTYSRVNYVLTSQAGPRDPKKPAPASYEVGGFRGQSIVMMMSLRSAQNGGPPYSISDSYTFHT